MKFEVAMMGLGLIVGVLVVSILVGFGMADNLQEDCNLDEDEFKIWLFGTAWIISSVIAGIVGTNLMINS